jgi:hypothetical protein
MTMSKDTDPSNEKKGKVITFPSGDKVNTDDVGVNAIIGQVGNVPTPEIIDPVTVAEEVKDRIKYIRKQELVKVIKEDASTASVVDAVLVEIAEELSHLKYERRKAAKEGKNTANYTVSRINSLRSMAELLLKRKEAALAERLDLKSPRLQKIFEVWMEFFSESMVKCQIPDHLIDLVFQQMKADMKDWEKKMETV